MYHFKRGQYDIQNKISTTAQSYSVRHYVEESFKKYS